MVNITIHDSHETSKITEVTINPNTTTREQLLSIGAERLNIEKPVDLFADSGQSLENPRVLQDGDRVFVSDGQKLRRNQLFHLCMLGAGAVGKSALTLQFIQGQFVPDYDPTIEDAYRKLVQCDGNATLLDVLDTAGQEDFVALRTSWMRGRDGFVLAFSIDDSKTLSDLEQFFHQLCEVYEDIVPPFVLVGNKADLPPEKREVTEEEGQRVARDWGATRYIETSAKTGYHVQDMFGGLVREIISTKYREENPEQQKSFLSRICSIL